MGTIIAKSANQIMLPKFLRGTNILYYICQTPFSSLEGGLGSRLSPTPLFSHTSVLIWGGFNLSSKPSVRLLG